VPARLPPMLKRALSDDQAPPTTSAATVSDVSARMTNPAVSHR
jgi:hypothetical protein